MGKRCLITGATGLIGRYVVSLLKPDWELYLLVRSARDDGSDGIHYIRCDLADAWDTDDFPKEIDAVIHLAQSEYFREFPAQGGQIFAVNTSSTVKLLEYGRCARAKTFVLASSGGIYGDGKNDFREDDPFVIKKDLAFYLTTKLCSEVLAESYASFMNIIILRFFFVYGPGQRTGMLIPRLVHEVNQGRPIFLHGQEGLKMNPTYVTDAATAVYRSLDLAESHKINVGGAEVLSLKEIGQQIGQVLNKKPGFEIQEHIEPQHFIGDIRKMATLLGYPSVKFKEGILKYVEWMNNEGYERHF